jgi:sensor c-di-GMP phosphodiesterase-like protein
MSNRLRTMIISCMLIALGVVLPVVFMSYISWLQAINSEQQRLATYAQIMVARAQVSIDETRHALHVLNMTQLTPCSDEHLALMRQLTVSSAAVEEIGYYDKAYLRCSSWGHADAAVQRIAPDYVRHDGIGVARTVYPAVARGEAMIMFQLGSYSVLMNIKRFVDLVVDDNVQLVLADEGGKSISEVRSPDPLLVARLIATPQDGMDHNAIYAVAHADQWVAMAIASRSRLIASWYDQLLFYLPIAALIDIALIVLVLRFSRRRLSPLAELEIGIRKREFIVHYQPIIDLQSGACIGAEALVRWRRNDGTLVRPDLFIPLAEEHGLITQITDQVIATVVRDLQQYLIADRALHVAINLSAADIKDGHVAPVLQQHLDNTYIYPEQIWLEVTERGFMDIASARMTIAHARASGYFTALDDFGTGYSSLQYLQGLPMDALKIDKSFVDTIGTSSASSSVIGHIIEMAKTLKMLIVAEGVEKQIQVDYLRAQGVHFVQGWFFSKPLTCVEFVGFYHKNQAQYGAAPELKHPMRQLKESTDSPVVLSQ